MNNANLTTAERLELLRKRLDANGVVHTCRAVNGELKRSRQTKRQRRQWQRDQIDMAVETGREMGLFPGAWTLSWWLIKWAVEAYLKRLFFEGE